MISYLLPTRNRPEQLARTLEALGGLCPIAHEPVGGAEIIVVDDASAIPAKMPATLQNGMPVRSVKLGRPAGAAARNTAVNIAQGEWVVMLDDDSYPLHDGVAEVIGEAPPDVAAIGAEILLPDDRHEDGGLPEVFVGCGAAVRREAFLDVGGYDATFDYYAEEYDFCARLLLAGWRVMHDWRFRVRHEKVACGRDMNRILHRLVRNNGWVIQRYAPPSSGGEAMREMIDRYRRIAQKEAAENGYQRGLDELARTRRGQVASPMTEAIWDRFTGRAAVEATLAAASEHGAGRGVSIALVDAGKNAEIIRSVLRHDLGCRLVDEAEAERLVIGTLSPGPMMDAPVAMAGRAQAGAAAVESRTCRRAGDGRMMLDRRWQAYDEARQDAAASCR